MRRRIAPMSTFPANTKQLYNICTMSSQRRRRWADLMTGLMTPPPLMWLNCPRWTCMRTQWHNACMQKESTRGSACNASSALILLTCESMALRCRSCVYAFLIAGRLHCASISAAWLLLLITVRVDCCQSGALLTRVGPACYTLAHRQATASRNCCRSDRFSLVFAIKQTL